MNVTIDAAEVQRVFRAYPVQSVRKLSQLIEGAAIDVQREMRLNSPTHDGQLRRSVKYKINPLSLSAEVWPDVDYAAAVEKGSKPHWTSVKEDTPLRKWADDKNISPYAVQASIAAKGTKANPFVKKTFDTMQSRVRRDIADGFSRFIDQVNQGVI